MAEGAPKKTSSTSPKRKKKGTTVASRPPTESNSENPRPSASPPAPNPFSREWRATVAEKSRHDISEANQRLNRRGKELAALKQILKLFLVQTGIGRSSLFVGTPRDLVEMRKVLPLLDHDDIKVRREALNLVGMLAPHGGVEAVDTLANTTLNDLDSALVIQTLDVIGRFGADLASHVIDQIAQMLEHPESTVRDKAFETLLALGNDAKSVAPKMVAAFLAESEDPRNSRWRQLLSVLGEDRLAELLLEASDDREALVKRLREIGTAGRKVRQKVQESSQKPPKWTPNEEDSAVTKILQNAKPKKKLVRNLLFLYRDLIHQETPAIIRDWWNAQCAKRSPQRVPAVETTSDELELAIFSLTPLKFTPIDTTSGNSRATVEEGIKTAKEFLEAENISLTRDGLLHLADVLRLSNAKHG